MNPAPRMVWLGLALTLSLGPAAGAQAPRTPSAVGGTPSSAAPALVSHVLPTYPQIAVAARVEGLVEIAARIEVDGRVAAVRVNRSIPLLDQAAIDAVRQWRFAPNTSANVTVTVRFTFNDPFRYPRPAIYRQPIPSWIPRNFAFVYKYECRHTSVEIDSIAQSVTNMRGYPPTARRFAFGFDVEQASDVFVTLVGAGFYDASSEGGRASVEGGRSTWQEVAPVEPGIQHAGDRIVVMVPAQPPSVEVSNFRQIQWFGGDQPARLFLHTLRVRRDDRWTELRWQEPLDARRPEQAKALAIAGKRIRALVKKNLTDARMQPGCL